jgi:hypothetical protein
MKAVVFEFHERLNRLRKLTQPDGPHPRPIFIY